MNQFFLVSYLLTISLIPFITKTNIIILSKFYKKSNEQIYHIILLEKIKDEEKIKLTHLVLAFLIYFESTFTFQEIFCTYENYALTIFK